MRLKEYMPSVAMPVGDRLKSVAGFPVRKVKTVFRRRTSRQVSVATDELDLIAAHRPEEARSLLATWFGLLTARTLKDALAYRRSSVSLRMRWSACSECWAVMLFMRLPR